MQMEIVHYNKGAVEVGEAICDRAKALPAAAVVMARCATVCCLLACLGPTRTATVDNVLHLVRLVMHAELHVTCRVQRTGVTA